LPSFTRNASRKKSIAAAAASDNAISHRRRRVHFITDSKCICDAPACQRYGLCGGGREKIRPLRRHRRRSPRERCTPSDREKDKQAAAARDRRARPDILCTTSYACPCTTPGPHGFAALSEGIFFSNRSRDRVKRTDVIVIIITIMCSLFPVIVVTNEIRTQCDNNIIFNLIIIIYNIHY